MGGSVPVSPVALDHVRGQTPQYVECNYVAKRCLTSDSRAAWLLFQNVDTRTYGHVMISPSPAHLEVNEVKERAEPLQNSTMPHRPKTIQ